MVKKKKSKMLYSILLFLVCMVMFFAIPTNSYAGEKISSKDIQSYMSNTVGNSYNWGGVQGTCTGAVRQALKDGYGYDIGLNVMNYNRDVLSSRGQLIANHVSLRNGRDLSNLKTGDVCIFYHNRNDVTPFHQGIIYNGNGKNSDIWHNISPNGVVIDNMANILLWYKGYDDVYVDVYRMNMFADDKNTVDVTKNGWVNVNGSYAYYENGKMVVNDWRTINNKTYYFGEDGLMYQGFKDMGNTRRYFNSNTGELYESGWKWNPSKKTWSYADKGNRGAFVKGYEIIAGQEYYFDDDFNMVCGIVEYRGKNYYYIEQGQKNEGALFRGGWLKLSKLNKIAYADKRTGAFLTGTAVIDGIEYTFDKEGFLSSKTESRVKEGGQEYLVDGNGKKMAVIENNRKANNKSGRGGNKVEYIVIHHWGITGQRFDNVVNYLCRPYDATSGSSAHYVVENGRIAYIVDESEMAWHAGNYYINQRSIGIECRPEATDGDYEYVGALVADIWRRYGSKLPLLRHKDCCATACPGIWNLDRIKSIAERYYNSYGPNISIADNTVKNTGWKKDKQTGKYSYENYKGQNVLGWNDIDGYRYYFDVNTGYMVNGWNKISNNWYWFDRNGHMETDWIKLSGRWYYLDSEGRNYTGWRMYNGKWVHLSEGMDIGWRKISNNWYWFDSNGYMETGWRRLAGRWYYFDSEGRNYTGWKKYNGKWVHFSEGMDTGWKKIDNVWYYFDGNGYMLTGLQEISGVKYNFGNNGGLITA